MSAGRRRPSTAAIKVGRPSSTSRPPPRLASKLLKLEILITCSTLVMPVRRVLVEAQATVAAGMIAGLIQIDEDARMAKRTIAAIAEGIPRLNSLRRRVGDQINRKTRIYFLLLAGEAR